MGSAATPRAHAHEKAEKNSLRIARARRLCACRLEPHRCSPRPRLPPLSDLDRRKARKIGTGKVEIDGRIDLHGMRQAEAHAALRGVFNARLRRRAALGARHHRQGRAAAPGRGR